MYETIDEPVSVVGVYSQGGFAPRKFRWKQQVYAVEQVTFVTEIRDGSENYRQYSVVSGGASYRLLFNRTHEWWRLKEVWCE